MDIAEDRIIVGTPEVVRTQIVEFAESFGKRQVILKAHCPGMSHENVMESIDLLGEHVMLHLLDMNN